MFSLLRVSPDVSWATFSSGAWGLLPSTNGCGRIHFLVVIGLRSPFPCWPSVRGHFQPLATRPSAFLATLRGAFLVPYTTYSLSSKPAKKELPQVESLSWHESYLEEMSSPCLRAHLIRSDSLPIISLS